MQAAITSISTMTTRKKRRPSTTISPSPKKGRRMSRKLAVASLAATRTASAALITPVAAPNVRSINPNRPLFATRTESFDAHTNNNTDIAIHTLILGTHPSIKSLEEQQYFGHEMNAFWWIAGDCLGFRRAIGLKKGGEEPYKFTSDLRHGLEDIIPYHQQVERLTEHGFALWDVVQSCQRKGSLDADIRDEKANDIRGFCQQHPSIQRIVLANGSTGCKIFKKHFQEWWESGELVAANDDFSQRNLPKTRTNKKRQAEATKKPITCICAIGVSPAAASYSYREKRDFWEQHVYQPGLKDYRESMSRLKEESSTTK